MIKTSFYITSIGIHQYLKATQSHFVHCKKALSDVDKRRNDLKALLLERIYSPQLVQKEIPPAKEIPRKRLLDKDRSRKKVN